MKTYTYTTLADLKSMMRSNITTFAYTKKDGTIRIAKGTLNPSLFTKAPKGGYNPAKEAGYCIYFDVEKDNFRCFDADKLLGVVEG